MEEKRAFSSFLKEIEMTAFDTNKTSTGAVTIQQSVRNELRRKGLEALVKDLNWLYGDEFDVVETKDGIVIVAENQPGDFTFSWELKSTIKSIDFDPFVEACVWTEEKAVKTARKIAREEEKKAKMEALAAKRLAKLKEIQEEEENKVE